MDFGFNVVAIAAAVKRHDENEVIPSCNGGGAQLSVRARAPGRCLTGEGRERERDG